MRNKGEAGQVTVLALGLAMVVFAVAGLAIDGTRVFLTRRSLQNIADAAAVSAAASVDRDAYYASGGGAVELDQAQAERMATRVVARRGMFVDMGFVTRGNTVEIVVRASARTTFLRLVGITEIPVAAAAVAAPFSQSVPAGP